MDFGLGAAVKPQSSAHPAEYVEHNISDAGSTTRHECLMELVAGRVESCQPKAEDKLPDVQFSSGSWRRARMTNTARTKYSLK
jgi:hypothetical protein